MRDLVRIQRLELRYRLPRRKIAAADRLDRVLAEGFEEMLEAALIGSGVRLDQEICLRSLEVPVRLRLANADADLSLAWCRALARSVQRSLAVGGDGVVRFESRRHALLDLLIASGAGDFRRAWAWKQLGFCKPNAMVTERVLVTETVGALASEPRLIPAMLAELGRRRRLASFLARLDVRSWQLLVAETLKAIGSPLDAGQVLGRESSAWVDWKDPFAERMLRHSEIASQASSLFREAAQAGLAPARAVLRAAAALSIAEVEPAALRAPAALRRIAEVEQALVAQAGPAAGEASEEEQTSRMELDSKLVAGCGEEPHSRSPEPFAQSLDEVLGSRLPPLQSERESGQGRGSVYPQTPQQTSPPRAQAWEPPGEEGPIRPTRTGKDEPPSRRRDLSDPLLEPAAEPDANEAVTASRRSARTRFGGLLFLLHLVRENGVPEEVAEAPVLEPRGLRWVLHQIARRILPVDGTDPAALAFAGLAPDAVPPDFGEAPPTEPEVQALKDLSDGIVKALCRRLSRPQLPEGAALAEVCRRQSEILFDPGWIDVRLRLEDVDTELRKIGLDLDLGWLPWLGVVVRFVYV